MSLYDELTASLAAMVGEPCRRASLARPIGPVLTLEFGPDRPRALSLPSIVSDAKHREFEGLYTLVCWGAWRLYTPTKAIASSLSPPDKRTEAIKLVDARITAVTVHGQFQDLSLEFSNAMRLDCINIEFEDSTSCSNWILHADATTFRFAIDCKLLSEPRD